MTRGAGGGAIRSVTTGAVGVITRSVTTSSRTTGAVATGGPNGNGSTLRSVTTVRGTVRSSMMVRYSVLRCVVVRTGAGAGLSMMVGVVRTLLRTAALRAGTARTGAALRARFCFCAAGRAG